MSETIRVSKTVAITIAISTDTRATMSVDMCSRFLTVDKNGLVKPMFVESVFPHDRLQVLHTEVLLTAFHGCILRGLLHTNVHEYQLLIVSLQDKNVVEAELQTETSKIRMAVNDVAIQKIYKCVHILLRTRN